MSFQPSVAGSAANRDNYMHLEGQPLRDYAHKIGAVSRSEAVRLTDDKVKEQCRYAIGRQYEDTP